MGVLQQYLLKHPNEVQSLWISAYDERPAGLFEGVDQRLIIEIIRKSQSDRIFTTRINRWKSEYRKFLFSRLGYNLLNFKTNSVPQILKLSSTLENSIVEKFYAYAPLSIDKKEKIDPSSAINYRSAGGRYWKVFLDRSFGTGNQSEKKASFKTNNPLVVISSLSSDVFWWYYSAHYDMFNLGDYQIFGFNLLPLDNEISKKLYSLGREYVNSLLNNSISRDILTPRGIVSQREFYVRKSKLIINEIDKVLAKHYGFTEEELDFIINYDIKYRMGDELNSEE